METQRVFLKGKFEKHIMCLSCLKKINFEKNKKFIYGKPERNT